MKMARSAHGMAVLLVAAAIGLYTLALAGTAQATPFFQIVGGANETQNFSPPILPIGAKGIDNEGVAMTIFLRDTTAPSGTLLPIRFEFIGSDASFTNEFIAGGGAIEWCWAGSGGCDPGFTQVTGPNNPNGPFAFSATITASVDSAIPFFFVADKVPGPFTVVQNGGAGIPDSVHFIALDMTNGFNFVSFNRTGTIFAVGLTDGNFAPPDDDHQDFILRMSVVPEPGTLLLMGAGALALGLASLRRKV